MHPTKQLRIFLLAFLGGILLSQLISLSSSIVFLFVTLMWQIGRTNFNNWLVITFATGLAYAHLYSFCFYPDTLNAFIGQSVLFKAEVQGEPYLSRAGKQTLRLKITAWKQAKSTWQPLEGRLLWQNAPRPFFSAGDKIEVQGVVSNLTNFSADFNTQVYWSRWGIAQSLIRAKVITRPPTRLPANYVWREYATKRLENLLLKPHLTVALGMLVGLKEKLPTALENDFKISGLQHLLVVSGTNVTLLILGLGLVLKPLGPWYKYSLSLIVLGFYLYLVGFDPPALRATLFGVLTGFALTSGFNIEFRNLFLLVTAFLTVIDPRFLTHDISFWLSFSATAGIIFGLPVVYKVLSFIKSKAMKLLLGASFCAQMAVFPILIVQFGSFPYAGFISNLITEPLVPLIMFLAAGGIGLGSLNFGGISSIWQTALQGSISALIAIAQFFGSFVPVYVNPVWGMGGAFLGLGFGLWACLSPYYQRHYWQSFEIDIKGR